MRLVLPALLGFALALCLLLWRWIRVTPAQTIPFRGRVAICIAGQLRGLDKLYTLQRYWIEPLNGDVFLALAWPSPEDRLECEQLLKPKAAVYENLDLSATPGVQPNVCAYWQRIATCDRLRIAREQLIGAPYDVVIRMRPDLIVTGPLPDAVLWRAASDNSEIILNSDLSCWSLGLNDILAIGGPRSIAQLCELSYRFDSLQPSAQQAHGAEAMLARHCARSWLQVIQCNLPVQFFTVHRVQVQFLTLCKTLNTSQGGNPPEKHLDHVLRLIFGKDAPFWRAVATFYFARF